MVADSQPGHIDQIKQTNAGAVYRLIDQLGPVSRIDLSRLAQLAPASITKIVREMLEAHLVQELEIKEAGSRGRPAVGLMVETEAWHYLSIRISRGEIFLALRDLSSKLVVEECLALPLNEATPLLERIITHVDRFFTRHQQKLERLTSIAITLPGIIDTENGVVHRMPYYEDVKEMPLGDALERHTGVPVYIQHDISAWTMAEALFGASRGARDVIQVVIDHNVGAGVITDGHLLHAGSSSLVEIGHTLILHRTVYLFCIMLPFALVVDLHYMTPFISVLISYTFIALDALAEELEDPFGTENNDLPLDAICNAIEIDLLQMNDERDIPAKRIPDKRYQLT